MRSCGAFVLAISIGACGVQTSEEPLDGRGGHGHGDDGDESDHAGHQGEDVIDGTDVQSPVYIKLGEPPSSTVPADPLGWDLRVSTTNLATNSGTSGKGTAGAVATTWTSIDDPITCPPDGYAEDTMLPAPGPPGSGEVSANPVLNDWYNYDPTTHAVTTKGIVYCIRTTEGKYGAIRVKNYAGGQMTLEWRHQDSGETAL